MTVDASAAGLAGGERKSEEQPDAIAIAHTSGIEMPSADQAVRVVRPGSDNDPSQWCPRVAITILLATASMGSFGGGCGARLSTGPQALSIGPRLDDLRFDRAALAGHRQAMVCGSRPGSFSTWCGK